MRRIKPTKEEKALEDALIGGEYVSVGKKEFAEIAGAIEARKKDAVLNIRINRYDLQNIKEKARKLGIKYQTLISEILHRVAQA